MLSDVIGEALRRQCLFRWTPIVVVGSCSRVGKLKLTFASAICHDATVLGACLGFELC